MNKLRERFKQNRGALIVESAFVYPIMLLVIFFMMYVGNMFLLRSQVDAIVAQEAIQSAAEYADANLATFEGGVPTSTDDERVTQDLYRYIDVFDLGGVQEVGDTDQFKNALESVDGFLAKMSADNVTIVEHEAHNYVLYQTYAVEVEYALTVPIRLLFSDDYVTLDMHARQEVPVTDTSEFVRNVDMVVDLTERTKAGTEFIEKTSDALNKVNNFINGGDGDGSGSSGAVSGGATDVTITDLNSAIQSKLEEYYKTGNGTLTEEQKVNLVKELQELYNNTPKDKRGDLLVPDAAGNVAGISYSQYGYSISYNWTSVDTVPSTRKMEVMKEGAMFDRVGSPYGKCVGVVDENGNCATITQRSIPYYFTESDITKEPSYHRYKATQDFTRENIEKAIKLSSSSNEEKNRMLKEVETYYTNVQIKYGQGDGLASGEIAPMFSGTGGGMQYDMPLNMNDLEAINMIEIVQ